MNTENNFYFLPKEINCYGTSNLFYCESPQIMPQSYNYNLNTNNFQEFELISLDMNPANNNIFVTGNNEQVNNQMIFVQETFSEKKIAKNKEESKQVEKIVIQNIQSEFQEESTKEPISSQIEEDSESKDKEQIKSQSSITDLREKKCKAKNQAPSETDGIKNYDKNICRYLARCSIRSFINEKYQSQVMKLCGNDEGLYDRLINYFTKNMEKITGFRVLKLYLIASEEDDSEQRQFKKIFKQFLNFFLKQRIIRYIMKGKMDNKLAYIKYKNEVMLKFLNKPEKWVSNKNKSPLSQVSF